VFWQDLDGNRVVEPCVAGSLDFVHAARADGCEDLVGAESVASGKRHGGIQLGLANQNTVSPGSRRIRKLSTQSVLPRQWTGPACGPMEGKPVYHSKSRWQPSPASGSYLLGGNFRVDDLSDTTLVSALFSGTEPAALPLQEWRLTSSARPAS
jgi:hypothetical protein